MSTCLGEDLEQCALVRELGLTYGEDVSKVKELMIDMDIRDNKVAAEMGIKHQQK